jgi:hypothetical protein
MSLSVLNSPPLVGLAGAASFALLPHSLAGLSWTALKRLSFLAYWINYIAVMRPGRIDGAALEAAKPETENTGAATQKMTGQDEMEQMGSGRRGRTLVAPSGWAFAIWGPIFLGELLLTAAQLILPPTSPMIPVLSQMAAPYITAQVFQTLWTASFRPKYKGWWMHISTCMLGGTAYSLSQAHAIAASAPRTYNGWEYALFILPISLHFGWTTAATLVNLNGAIAVHPKNVSASTVAVVGHVSVVAATILGVTVTLTRTAPVVGSVIAWALMACASGMTKRLAETKKEDANRVGVYGAALQKTLCQVGAAMSSAASVVAVAVLMGAIGNKSTKMGGSGPAAP